MVACQNLQAADPHLDVRKVESLGRPSLEAKTLRQASAGDLFVEPQRWGHDFNQPFYIRPGEGANFKSSVADASKNGL